MNLPSSIWPQIEQLSHTLRCSTIDFNLDRIQTLLLKLRDALGADDLVVCVFPVDKPDWGLLLPDTPGEPLLGYLGNHPFIRELRTSSWIVRQRKEQNSNDAYEVIPSAAELKKMSHALETGCGWQPLAVEQDLISLYHKLGESNGFILARSVNSLKNEPPQIQSSQGDPQKRAVFSVILDLILGSVQEVWQNFGLHLSPRDAEIVSTQLSQDYIILARDFTHVLGFTPGGVKRRPHLQDTSPWEWTKWMYPEDRLEFIQACVEISKTESALNLQIRGADSRWVQIRAFPRRTSRGEVLNYLGVIEDISAVKTRETELAEARDMEILLSARIQKALLSGFADLIHQDLSFAGMTLPSKQVDGDFYDAITNKDGSVDLIIGDVMGKGVAASLLGAATRSQVYRVMLGLTQAGASAEECTEQGDLRGLASLPHITEVIRTLDTNISPDLVALNQFITMTYGRLSQNPPLLEFVDCGHPPVIFWDSEQEVCWQIKGSNMPIGFSAGQIYRSHLLPLNPGDLLIFYSDGLTEADNYADVPFDTQGIRKYITQIFDQNRSESGLRRATSPREIIYGLSNQALIHSGGRFNDDVTLIAVQISENAQNRSNTSIHWNRSIDGLSQIREQLTAIFLRTCPDDQEIVQQLILAAHEGLMNIADHSSEVDSKDSGVSISAAADDVYLWIIIDYHGDNYEWQDIQSSPIHEYHERGYGRFIMDQLVSSLTVLATEDSRKRLVLAKNRESSSNR